MNLETVIADKITEKVRALPTAKQEKILKFVEEVERAEIVEPPSAQVTKAAKKTGRLALIGLFDSGKSDVSERAEEILFEEIDKRSGWTIKK